jgi:hypothetical protein
MTLRLYVATSWAHPRYNEVVARLREAGFRVFDWRNPPSGENSFSWSRADANWRRWSAAEYRGHLLGDPQAAARFCEDFRAMRWADVGVLLLPAGRDAHLEIGFLAGAGKRTVVLLDEPVGERDHEPELMCLMCSEFCTSVEELIETLW